MAALPFQTHEMARGYASSRPPLHKTILQMALDSIGFDGLFDFSLDIGCGAGMSLLPLLPCSRIAVGVDPSFPMVSLARNIALPALLLTARGEALPLPSGAVDMITAAGSLNYSDPGRVFAEAARVLKPGGVFCVYDFSQGRHAVSTPRLGRWFARFARRYPCPRDEAISLSPRSIRRLAAGFRLEAERRFRLSHPMTLAGYADYLMTETNVSVALGNGTAEREIRKWLETTLDPVFGESTLDVQFPGYFICLRRV